MSLKNKYSLFYILFCLAGCCLAGFVAVFLQFKGVSNTMIGLVTGLGCISSVVLSPYLSNLIIRKDNLNALNMISGIYIVVGILFVLMAVLPLPGTVVVAGYILAYSLYTASASFPQVMAGDYMREGLNIDYGLARGLGSASWAVTALVMGPVVDIFSPLALAAVYVVFTVCMVMLLKSMPVVKTKATPGEKSGTAMGIIKNYKVYFLMLVGFAFCLSAHSMLGTYLPNIVASLGGSTSLLGTAIFFMALSELPVMAKTTDLMAKFDSMTLVLTGGVAYIIRNFTVCFAPNLTILIIGLLFQSFSYALLTAVITYYAILKLKKEDRVMGQALIGIITTGFGSTVGNLSGGFLQDNFGLPAMYFAACRLTVVGMAFLVLAKITNDKTKA